MAVILNSTKSTTGSPYVYYEVSAEEVAGTRTADSVQIKWGARARLANGDSTLGTGNGYGIIGHLKINNTEISTVTIKGTSTKWTGNSWHNYVYNTFTLTGLSALQTSIGSITFNASRTSGSSSSAGYMTAKSCSDITFSQGAAPSYITGGTTGILGTAHNITFSSYSDSFTHKLEITMGGITSTIADNITTSGLSGSVSWTPDADYAKYNTEGNKVYGTLTLTTNYGNGSGVSTASVELTIPDNSTTKSGISISTSDTTGLTSTYTKYVQSKSYLEITPTFTPYKNSYARSYYYEIKQNDDYGTLLSYGYGDGNNKYYWTPTYVGQVYIKITLTDSRYFVSTNDTTIQVAAYSQPNISKFDCERNATTSSTIDCYFAATSTNINSANANTTNYTLYYKKTSDNNYTSISLTPGYSIDYSSTPYQITGTSTADSYDVYLQATDQFESPTKSDIVPSAFTLMNFNASGKAMAIGKVSEATGNNKLFEVGMDTNINGITRIRPPQDVWTALDIHSSNRNEASIAYHNQALTQRYVVGYGTNNFDGFGVFNDNNGNVLTISNEGNVSAKQSFRIPANSNNGYGLVDHNGTSIIKDWDNGTITMNATGGTLFLGHQTTGSINFLDGKGTWDTSGLKIGNSKHYCSNFDLVQNGGGYVRLCRVASPSIGSNGNLYLKAFTGDGWNGNPSQNAMIIAHIKKSYDNMGSALWYGCTYSVYGSNNYNDNVRIYIRATSIHYLDIYLYSPYWYSSGRFELEGQFDSVSNVNDWRSASTPTDGTEQQSTGGLVQMSKTLYDNSSGTNGDVYLSETSANFKYIDIQFRGNDGENFVSSQRIYDPNGKYTTLLYAFIGDDNGYLYQKARTVYINGTLISTLATNRYSEAVIRTSSASASKVNQIYITKVMGYR